MKRRITRPLTAAALATALTAAVTTALTGTGTATAAPASAADAWQQVSSDTFYLTDALQRSQGVTTDGNVWYFSWQYGLSKVSLSGGTLASNRAAIPAALALQGDNHIGGIDYYDGKLYVPIEDGSKYQHPYIAVYDAATLSYTGTAFALPQDVQRDGVPWTAVGDGYLLSSEYDATAVNFYSLTDGSLVKRVPLSSPVPHVQGAKVHEGALYASSDGTTKAVYRIDLGTGAVTRVLTPSLPGGTEVEALTFLPRPDGSLMHVLDVAPNRLSVNFRHYRP
ncbi:hypothetical protein DZF91_29915 [Actinomadura logoneensis]|uniref:DUF6923 domain-containing protein n=1 Tax=Actinomadura logoneensis TaxID=2293572 RepID=A0A372JDB9_9ACTN|nr:hypothetical protein [Actinomadura logoneensis]RFU38005.1 hypothetical protein DZF91_29915 [Actinomadura logoneensis]